MVAVAGAFLSSGRERGAVPLPRPVGPPPLLWIGAGTAEENMHQGAQAMHAGLDQAGIKNIFFESPGTAHEWQTCRRDLNDFAPRLFR